MQVQFYNSKLLYKYLPLDTSDLIDQPSDPIHEKVFWALFLLTAFMTSATSWSEANTITPENHSKNHL